MAFRICLGKQDTKKLQNLHFANSAKQDKTDKGYKIKPITDHLKKLFQAVFSDESEQSIDEHMTKFKGHSSIRQYWKWHLQNRDLNGVLDGPVPLGICTSLICILLGRKMLKLI